MSHFNLKSLAFYGVAIGSVVVLFKVVTAYGETRLKAPPPIGGAYRISAQNLPGCLQSDELVLDIQQSGIYLFGSLLPTTINEKAATVAEEKPSLTGNFQNQQLHLEGSIPWISGCNASVKQANGAAGSNWVKIQGVVKGETLVGQIALSSTPTATEFTAQREARAEQSRSKH